MVSVLGQLAVLPVHRTPHRHGHYYRSAEEVATIMTTWVKWMIVLFIAFVLIMVSLMFVRNIVNSAHCEAVLGLGASWVGDDECTLPPVDVSGLWTGMLP
jgi:hypothetical protein